MAKITDEERLLEIIKEAVANYCYETGNNDFVCNVLIDAEDGAVSATITSPNLTQL